MENAGPPREYIIGDLTFERVFEKNGITDLYDLQLVLDAMEAALVAATTENGSNHV